MKPMIRVNVMNVIITVIMIMTMITTVGCGTKKEPVTNEVSDLLYRETNVVSEVSEISQYQ